MSVELVDLLIEVIDLSDGIEQVVDPNPLDPVLADGGVDQIYGGSELRIPDPPPVPDPEIWKGIMESYEAIAKVILGLGAVGTIGTGSYFLYKHLTD